MEKEEKKEEKEIKTEKNSGHIVLNTILIIILLIAFLGIGFAVGSTEILKGLNPNKEVTTVKDKTTSSKTNNLSVIDERVTEAIKVYEQVVFNPEDAYESDVTKLTKKELIITALKGLANEQINYCKGNENDLTIEISIDDLNKSLKKAIPDGKISIEDLQNNANETTSYSIGGYGYTFKYENGTKEEYSLKIKDNKIYVVGPCGHEGPNETTIESIVEKAELSGNELNIYKKVAFAKTEFSAALNGLVYDYYKDKEYKTKEETKTLNEEPTWNQYNTYKLTFKKNKGKYYFESSKLQ